MERAFQEVETGSMKAGVGGYLAVAQNHQVSLKVVGTGRGSWEKKGEGEGEARGGGCLTIAAGGGWSRTRLSQRTANWNAMTVQHKVLAQNSVSGSFRLLEFPPEF